MVKTNFQGGIQTQTSPEKSDFANTHQLLVNGRVRNNVVEPVRAPGELTFPVGTLQCHAVFDDNHLIFVDGVAYYRKFSQTFWNRIPGATLSSSAGRVYVEPIPGSAVNFVRKTSTAALDLSSPVGSSKSCLFCTDGESQPIVIFPDGSARVTNTWSQWSVTDREYVPVCILPKFVGAILYVVTKDSDGRWTQITRSVSGRPLDFVLLVNDAGDKAGSSENDFGAPALRFHISYDPVTALVGQQGGTLLGTTVKASTFIIPDFDRTVAGEPTFIRQPLFDVGAFGPEAITELNGDTAIVYPGGIRTFNAVEQLKWQGKNSPLNRSIQNLTTSALQTTGATCLFDNYTGFAVQTKFGPGIVWWDQTLSVFVAVDIWPGVSKIVEFASAITATDARLFFRTDDNKLFEAFTGAFGENQIVLQDICSGDPAILTSIRTISLGFLLGTTAGYGSADIYADRSLIPLNTEILDATSPQEDPSARPITPGLLVPDTNTLELATSSTIRAYKNTVVVRWTGDAKLSSIRIDTETQTGVNNRPTPVPQTQIVEPRLIFFADDGVLTDARIALNQRMRALSDVTAYIGAGDHAYDSGTDAEVAARLKAYWNTEKLAGKFYAAPGNHDLDTDIGRPFFQFVRQTPERYSKYSPADHTDIFLFNSGINTAGTQVDPANLDGADLLSSTQAKTLLADLAASTARNKIVVWHHPPYTSSATYYPGITTLQPLTEAIADAGASALICGHAHLYERLNKHLPIFIVGTGGQALHSVSTTLAEGSKKVVAAYGYLSVRPGPVRCTYTFVDTDGAVRDRFIT